MRSSGAGGVLAFRGSPLPVLSLLVLSAAAVGVAPLVMADGYSWVSHAISESAAQAQEGAWVARLGFLLMGFAVLRLDRLAAPRRGRAGAFLLGAFGVLLVEDAFLNQLFTENHIRTVPGTDWLVSPVNGLVGIDLFTAAAVAPRRWRLARKPSS